MIPLPHAITSQTVADILGAPLLGAPEVQINNIGSIKNYSEHSLIFSENAKVLSHPVGCLLTQQVHPLAMACIIVKNPKRALQQIIEHYAVHKPPLPTPSIHPTAIVDASAVIGNNVHIGPYAVIEAHVHIADNCSIGPHCHIMPHCHIGKGCTIDSSSVIYPRVTMGSYVHIGAHCVLGDEGFGYDWNNTSWQLTPQIADLVIGDHVAIGPLSVIDRGALDNTTIGDGSKLDAHMMIGHGVTIGKNVVMAACGAVGGSSVIGDFTLAGGCAQIADHITIAPQTRLAGSCSVGRNITKAEDYISQIPAMPARLWRKWYKDVLRVVAAPSPHTPH